MEKQEQLERKIEMFRNQMKSEYLNNKLSLHGKKLYGISKDLDNLITYYMKSSNP